MQAPPPLLTWPPACHVPGSRGQHNRNIVKGYLDRDCLGKGLPLKRGSRQLLLVMLPVTAYSSGTSMLHKAQHHGSMHLLHIAISGCHVAKQNTQKHEYWAGKKCMVCSCSIASEDLAMGQPQQIPWQHTICHTAMCCYQQQSCNSHHIPASLI